MSVCVVDREIVSELASPKIGPTADEDLALVSVTSIENLVPCL